MEWFQENFASITLWLQGIDLVGAITLIVLVVRQIISTKSSLSSSKLLKSLSTDNKMMIDSINSLLNDYSKLQSHVDNMNTKINDVVDSVEKINTKINAMFDMFSLVYQTIKNEDTRTAVNNIIMNARYNETITREKLLEQVETLKKEVVDMTQQTSEKVNNIVEQSTQLLTKHRTPRG